MFICEKLSRENCFVMFYQCITHFKEQIGRKEKSVYKHLKACDARFDVSEELGHCVHHYTWGGASTNT